MVVEVEGEIVILGTTVLGLIDSSDGDWVVVVVVVVDVDLCVVVEVSVVVVELAAVVMVVIIVEAGTGLEVETGIDGLEAVGVSMKVGGRMVDPMTVGLV